MTSRSMKPYSLDDKKASKSALTDTDNFKNYRPVSNLMFVSKLIERVVDIRLREQLVRNRLLSEKNYGYEKHHSTELLLLKVVNDLYQSFDKKHSFSASFVRLKCSI